ncbi:2'-5' RNA ligase [Paenibacillus endophyticus]|uniref:RNA 2',3'-cyclic phosphodiesterase n=1 Tax=Paenibacillus endophyticus TaxID=1294268 RepID=A0A7W5CDB3_9BACL|nr:RNA 2',3'-cyclic phosphodiesterase [Paenibacillus endophyticus]MBB3155612.1 2'-5' RNA ligase [Paenibacillus endophyticus]
MSSEPLRLFIAIPIDQKWRERLTEQSRRLKSNLYFQKWTHPEDYHITLKFLGDTSIATIQQIQKLLSNVALATEPFELRAKGWGTFGAPTSPSILWASVGGDLDALTDLHRRIEDSLEGLYPRENRAFSPHLTIARRYKGKDQLKTAIDDYFPDDKGSENNWFVKEIQLYESNLETVPMYKPIATFTFA